MAKYESKDDRTGYVVGRMVELTDEELVNTPFNVFMRKVEPIDEKAVVEDRKAEEEKESFRHELVSKGLSPNRVEEVLKDYPSKKDLSKSIGNIALKDKLTVEFLENEYKNLKFDLDGDGDFDADDKTIAAKAMRKKTKKKGGD